MVPFFETTIVETGKETEIGICVNIEPLPALPPPHAAKVSVIATELIRQIDKVARGPGRMITPFSGEANLPKHIS